METPALVNKTDSFAGLVNSTIGKVNRDKCTIRK